jgi:alkylation response protein AidB-like acyl-CoA dehydrogenase
MELEFSEQQNMLRESVASLCADRSDSSVIRALASEECGYSEFFWAGLRDMGLTGLLIDEKYGGVALGALDCALVYEEFGRSLAQSPHFESCVLAARLLTVAGTESQRTELLPAIATGEQSVTVAWQEAGSSGDINSHLTTAVRDSEYLVLNGEKVLVPYASSVENLIVTCRLEGGSAAIIVPAELVRLRAQPNHADQALYAVELDGIRVPQESVLETDEFEGRWQRAMLEGQIALAAQAIGGACRMQEMAIEYAGQREQFGQPIGAFQAIAHYLADRATEIEGARYLVYQAAWACNQGVDFAQLAMMAKMRATAVYRQATVTGVQVHGGMGFSEEADPQLFYRRAKHMQLMYWDARYLEQRIAEEVFA